MTSNNCRFCNAELKETFVDLGLSPLANSFLTNEMLNSKEFFYPLKTYVCNECLLVQCKEFENPQNIFSDYAYFSSYSRSWLDHSRKYVDLMIQKFGFDSSSLVVEIASNDGYLLQFFKKMSIPILGIEPAANVAKVAEENGIPTIVKFFGTKTATELFNVSRQADLIIANNVLAHVPNLNDFVEGLRILLKPKGIITIEFPHLMQLIKNNQFDTIYHEHFSYFSLITVQKIFSFHNMEIFDVEELHTHGGSLRIYVKHMKNDMYKVTGNVMNLIDKEKLFGLEQINIYKNFQKKVDSTKLQICNFFSKAKKENKKIVAYGAPAKGNTLLNYCSIGNDFIEYTVDLSKHKQGMYLPGTHIPIKSPEKIYATKPDYVIILPWNLKEEIIQQMSGIREWGGKFVVLIPEVKVYS